MRNKNAIIITLVISLLSLLLCYLNKWQVNYIALFICIIIISFLTMYIQNNIDKNALNNHINYNNLDILKYICAILILILHLRPFLHYYYPNVDFAFNNIITRICVPIFFMITGYFVAKKEKDNPNYIISYCKKMIPSYLIYSLAYLPILISYAYDNRLFIMSYLERIPDILFIPLMVIGFPLVMLVALVYAGIYYHLWYFPAVILSLLVLNKWKKHFKLKYLLIISFILLLFGATETYYGILPLAITQIIKFYFDIFITTRNFLFFGLFYTVLGYWIGKKDKLVTNHCFILLIISIFLLALEAVLLRNTERLNSNILLSCIPLTYFLFVSVIFISKKTTKINFRGYSKYYYIVHPMVIYLLFKFQILNIYSNPYWQIFLVLAITHLLSLILIKLKKQFKNLPI